MAYQQVAPVIDYDNEIDVRRNYLIALSQMHKTEDWHVEYANRKICCDEGNLLEQQEVLPLPLVCI